MSTWDEIRKEDAEIARRVTEGYGEHTWQRAPVRDPCEDPLCEGALSPRGSRIARTVGAVRGSKSGDPPTENYTERICKPCFDRRYRGKGKQGGVAEKRGAYRIGRRRPRPSAQDKERAAQGRAERDEQIQSEREAEARAIIDDFNAVLDNPRATPKMLYEAEETARMALQGYTQPVLLPDEKPNPKIFPIRYEPLSQAAATPLAKDWLTAKARHGELTRKKGDYNPYAVRWQDRTPEERAAIERRGAAMVGQMVGGSEAGEAFQIIEQAKADAPKTRGRSKGGGKGKGKPAGGRVKVNVTA